MDKLNRSYQQLQAEVKRQMHIIYSVSVSVLWETFGFRDKRIWRFLESTKTVLDTFKDDEQERSPIQVLDEETGMEFRLDGENHSWRDIIYLNGEKWMKNKNRMNAAQVIYANNQQKKYVAVNMLAVMCITLHRCFGFGWERLSRFMAAVDGYRTQFNNDIASYSQLLFEKTGMRVENMPFRYEGRKA